ncbi:MAG: hypothetical protein NTV77_00735 [Candidatus Azambacteria bacterium]|nr:hypothetical protein [Candidatus Azambacteria bacterium]
MSKKTFYIILIILAGLLIIGGIIWYFIFNSSVPATSPEGPGFTTPGQNAAKQWQPISENRVISAHFSDNSILFYDFSGNLWQFKNDDLKPTPIDQTAIENPAETIWSVNGKNIVKAGLNQSDISYAFSDFSKKIFTNLRANIKSVVFSPDGSKIAYYLSDGLNINSLYTSNPDGKSQKSLIGTLKLRDINLLWPKNNIISITSMPSGLTTGNLWVLNMANLGLTKLIDGLYGLETLWSPDGNNFIYSHTDQNDQNPKLAIYKNGVSKDINNISTLVDKCAWAEDSINIYCAIPQSWPDSVVLPDDYYKNTFSTIDDLWKINTETGEKNLVFQGIGNISNLDVNPNNNSLIFISRNSRFLYQLKLTP